MVKRLFVLVVLLVPALAWGACPRSIAGTYSLVQDELRLDKQEQTVAVGIFTLGAGATSTQTAPVSISFYAGTNYDSSEQSADAEVSVPPTVSARYRYDGKCRLEFYNPDDDNPGKFSVWYGVVAGTTLYTFRGPGNMNLPAAMLSSGATWIPQNTSHGIVKWLKQ